MSAPETNALPPAPVTTMTRTPSSFSKSSMICAAACHMSSETALWRAGLLKMMRPTAPSFSAIILVVMGWSSMALRAPRVASAQCGRWRGALHPPILVGGLVPGHRQAVEAGSGRHRAVRLDPPGHDDGEQQQPDREAERHRPAAGALEDPAERHRREDPGDRTGGVHQRAR